MRQLICSVAIISLSIASTCIANTDDNNVMNLNIISADKPYTLTKMPDSNCTLADGKQLPQTLSLQPGASPQLFKIALQPNSECLIHYDDFHSFRTFFFINIWTFQGTLRNSINYRDGATSDDGDNMYDQPTYFIAYSNGQKSR